MPCWYYDKKELKNTASARDGIDVKKEARYRREGARFIIDTGTRMGLRYDTCATGVVYFHRFYMFYSFKDFPRYVTAACCLFLAGKVEETPKKCKDLIKATRGMLTEAQFNVFGDDPKEEVMMLERILLQSLKFDLQVEHPYAFLLKYAKLIKGDKAKVQNMVQMAWTFVNDSLCTTLSLQWEPDTIAVALMYLASRLKKIDIQDWQGKPPAYRGKWWEFLIEDVSLELLEDICHQVLDLYSSTPQAKEDSPPPAPGTKPHQNPTKTSQTFLKRPDSQPNLEAAASKTQASRAAVPGPPPAKVAKVAKVEVKKKRSRTRSPSPAPSHRKVKPQTPVKDEVVRPISTAPPTSQTAAPPAAYPVTQPPYPAQSYTSTYPAAAVSAPAAATTLAATTYTTYPPPPHAAQYTQPPSQTATTTQYPQPGYQAPGYQQGTTYPQPYQQQYAQQPQAQTAQQPAAYNQQQPPYNQYAAGQTAQYGQYPQAANYSQYPNASYSQYPTQQQPFQNQQQYAAYSGHQPPYRPPAPPQPAQQPTPQPAQQQQQPYAASQAYPARPPAPRQPYTQPPRPPTLPQQPASSAAPSGPGLPTVRITGRR